MTTNRSRNKLERKAHMNIHDTIEVVEGELRASDCFTRDRFGKKQVIKVEEHSFRGHAPKALAFIVLLAGFASWAYAASAKNTNVAFESEPKDLSFLNEKPAPKEKVTFYSDDKTTMDINDDGDPNVNMRF